MTWEGLVLKTCLVKLLRRKISDNLAVLHFLVRKSSEDFLRCESLVWFYETFLKRRFIDKQDLLLFNLCSEEWSYFRIKTWQLCSWRFYGQVTLDLRFLFDLAYVIFLLLRHRKCICINSGIKVAIKLLNYFPRGKSLWVVGMKSWKASSCN